MSRSPVLLRVIAIAALSGCGSSINTLQVTVDTYISAVSLGDTARILDLSAGYQRELAATETEQEADELARRYRGMIESGYMQWDLAKATGVLSLDDLGIALIRGIGLGKEGAAAIPLGVEFEEGSRRATVITRAITNYESIRWESIPAGGRMYLMGMPFGRVINFATGYDDPADYELLETIDLEWTLVRIEDVGRTRTSPGDWFVESIRPLEETATSWFPPSDAS